MYYSAVAPSNVDAQPAAPTTFSFAVEKTAKPGRRWRSDRKKRSAADFLCFAAFDGFDPFPVMMISRGVMRVLASSQ